MGATLTIRNLDPDVKRALRRLAAEHGVSREQEARDALARAVASAKSAEGTWRLKASRPEIMALGGKAERRFDLKALSDEMWDEGLL